MRAHVRGLTNTAVLTSAAFVLFTTSLIVGLEAYCRYRDRHPTSQDFATLMDYPADPERYFKIAIFGESAAGGANSISKFEDVIRGEITRRNAAGRPVYVHNYAARGVMFHNQQAETVKANIGRYDAVLIYAGLSEFIAYSEDRTFLGIPIRAAGRKAAFVVEDANPVEQYLNSQSHLYGWFKRFQQRHPQWSAVVVSDGAIGK